MDLIEATLENTPLFDVRTSMEAKVISVYDGDTYTAAVKLPLQKVIPNSKCNGCGTQDNIELAPIAFKCRISGIDTPELRTRDANEKKYAKLARMRTRELILEKIVTINCYGFDKYGRLLTSVFEPASGDVGLTLIGENLAVGYEGKKKTYDWGKHSI